VYRIELTEDELRAAEKTMRGLRMFGFILTPAGKTYLDKLGAAYKRMLKGAKG
jgi:hypothetical protein